MSDRPMPLRDDGPDPGNLVDRIDEEDRAGLHVDHRALGGGPHVTPEDVERHEADLLLIARMEKGAP